MHNQARDKTSMTVVLFLRSDVHVTSGYPWRYVGVVGGGAGINDSDDRIFHPRFRLWKILWLDAPNCDGGGAHRTIEGEGPDALGAYVFLQRLDYFRTLHIYTVDF